MDEVYYYKSNIKCSSDNQNRSKSIHTFFKELSVNHFKPGAEASIFHQFIVNIK